ncbi:MAG: hypothetical protein ACKO6N_01635 [Myxococcota bacterium]
MSWRKWSVIGLLSFVACSGGSGDTESPTPEGESTPTPEAATATPAATPTPQPVAGEGRLALRFKLQEDWYDYLNDRGETPAGPFWGAVYGGTVGDTGPGDDSVMLADVYVENVTFLPNDGVTEVLLTTDILPTGVVYVLGFVDSDGNADLSAPGPDGKDPVTVPSGNAFTVKANETVEIVVYFDMLFPSGQ